jgi:hypothetical protein
MLTAKLQHRLERPRRLGKVVKKVTKQKDLLGVAIIFSTPNISTPA